jgi:hypothetical protein
MSGSPLAFDFDFTNLIISGKSIGEFNVENDIYSDWKELVSGSVTGLEASAPPAFLESNDGITRAGGSIGGNPLGGGQQIAPYFFMNNTDGWRFRSAEADGETILNGNLFPLDPDGDSLFIPTIGAFTAIIKLVVSPQSLVTFANVGGLSTAQDDRLTRLYDQVEREIYVDTSLTPGSPAPNGSQQAPFTTFAEAADLAELIGVNNIRVLADSTLDRVMQKFNFRGTQQVTLDLNGQSVTGSVFRELQLAGEQSGRADFHRCDLSDGMIGLRGHYFDCGIDGDVTLDNNARVIMTDPHSDIPGLARPTITVGTGTSRFALRRYAGGMTILGMTVAENKVTIELAGGKVTLDASCVAGDFTLRGVGQFTDESLGTVVDTSGFIQADDITFIKGLVGGDAIVSLDDQTITVYNNDVSPRQVLAVYSVSADGRVRTRTS